MFYVWDLYDAGSSESRGLFATVGDAKFAAKLALAEENEFLDDADKRSYNWKETLSEYGGIPAYDAGDGYTLILPRLVKG